MKNMRRVFATLSAVAVMSGMFGALTVHAFDAKVYPATGCVLRRGSSVGYTITGELLNTSPTGSPMVVTCPVVRDTAQGQWTGIEVWVIDARADAEVTCRTISARPDGEYEDYRAFVSSGIGQLGRISLTLPPTRAATDGAYLLDCRILSQLGSATSGIASYRIVEPTAFEID
jgi:hypothetical protein